MMEGEMSVAVNEVTTSEPRTEPRCKVCRHPKRRAIEAALLGGASDRAVVQRYSLSRPGVRRHRPHMPAIERTPAAAEPAEPDTAGSGGGSHGMPGSAPMKLVAPFRMTDSSGYLFDLPAGRMCEGATLAKVWRLGGRLAAPSDSELAKYEAERNKFAGQHGAPTPKRVVPERPAALMPAGLSPDEIATRVKLRPELVGAQRERAGIAHRAARAADNFQHMDRMMMIYGSEARATDLVGQFGVWRFAESWFWDRVGK
jgi:hypothetical protein